MFSDFRTRGFGLEDSHIRHPDRLARLLLWSWRWPCIGRCPPACGRPRISPRPPKKKAPEQRPKKLARGRTSLSKRGLRRIQRFLQLLILLPPLSSVWSGASGKTDGR